MPLTPEDVRNKRFTPVRLREGYDMAEVDSFLDEVEAELERMVAEEEELRQRVKRSAGTTPAAQPQSAPAPARTQPAAESPTPPVAEGTAGTRAARLLEIAASNADELVAEAQAEAEVLLRQARTEAEELTTTTKTEAERRTADAKAKAEEVTAIAKAEAEEVTRTAKADADALGAQTERRRQELLGELVREKAALKQEIEHLRTFEREYRNRLREYLTSHLATLDGEEAEGATLPTGPAEQNGRPQG